MSSSYSFHTVISIWLQHGWILPKEPINIKSYTQTRFHNWNTMSYDFHDKLSHELFHFEQTVVFDMAFRQAKVQTLRCYSWCTCAAIVLWYYNCLYYWNINTASHNANWWKTHVFLSWVCDVSLFLHVSLFGTIRRYLCFFCLFFATW